MPLPEGIDHPAFGIVRSLLDRGRAWLKLSGPYLDSRVGEAQRYSDMDRAVHAWVNAAPERLVWGSDWPHTTEAAKPDDAALFDLLSHWVENPTQRRAILVDNPATLYDF